jgi:hypothetical protein
LPLLEPFKSGDPVLEAAGMEECRIKSDWGGGMKLYDFTRAPNPRRVRIFLAEKGITVPMEQIDLFTGANRTPEALGAILMAGCRSWNWMTAPALLNQWRSAVISRICIPSRR